MKKQHLHGFIVFGGLLALASFAGALFLFGKDRSYTYTAPLSTPQTQEEQQVVTPAKQEREGKYVLVLLDEMRVELHDGTTTLQTFPIISKGKPGSYYETPGGEYINDYKIPLHFSSIGLVYMPKSIHIFGNFFIHGIPYYPSGEKVDSTYSGGCIRLSDPDSKVVYDFITRGTPIVITQTAPSLSDIELTLSNEDTTRYMVGLISLEFLTQDNEVTFEGQETTRKKLLPELIVSKNNAVAKFYARTLSDETFISVMNQKAKAIGMKDTTFTSVTESPVTTDTDKQVFSEYIRDHKRYLLTLEVKTWTK